MSRRKEVIYKYGRYAGKYLSDEECVSLEKLMNLDINHGVVEDLKNVIWDLSSHDVDMIKEAMSNEPVDFTDKRGKLLDHQTLGVAYMFFAKRLVLGDSVGLGKTVEVAGLLNLLENNYMKSGKEFRFLYLTNKNIVSQAQDELIKFTGNYVQTVYGEKPKVKKFIENNYGELTSSVVGTHSLIKSLDFQEYLRGFILDTGDIPFDALIIDESGDILSNTATQMYKDGMYLANMFERVILLNATPFEKELRSFYAQLNFVDSSLLPTKSEFSNTYEVFDYYGNYPTFSGKYKNQEEFRKLVSYRYFARTRQFLGAEMKDCTAEVVELPVTDEQRYLLKRTSMSQMVFDCPSYFTLEGIPTNVDTTPKLAAVLRILRDDWRDAKSVLIYARYKEAQWAIYQTLDELGYNVAVMNGDTSEKEREDTINRFRLGDISVLVTNVQKGLNFGNCNHCIFYNFDPNTNNMVQFEGRMTRSFNIYNKHVKMLLTKGQELSTFNKILSDRAEASNVFAGSDYSCVLSLLINEKEIN
jgi:superfamily II DNA or RNA helicase